MYLIKILQNFCDKDLEEELRKSTARWKIAVGHHAIRSIGHHGDSPELVKHLVPVLKVYAYSFYLRETSKKDKIEK